MRACGASLSLYFSSNFPGLLHCASWSDCTQWHRTDQNGILLVQIKTLSQITKVSYINHTSCMWLNKSPIECRVWTCVRVEGHCPIIFQSKFPKPVVRRGLMYTTTPDRPKSAFCICQARYSVQIKSPLRSHKVAPLGLKRLIKWKKLTWIASNGTNSWYYSYVGKSGFKNAE